MSTPAIHIDNVSKEFLVDGLGDYQRATEVFASWLRSKFSNEKASIAEAKRGETQFAHRAGTRRFVALENISLEVQCGETLGIVGSNGAGKSTLLKILSRIVTPTRGRVGVAGRVGCLLEVGTGFHPELTGRENVFLNGAILGMPRREIRKRFDEIVAFAEVEEFLDMPVKRYSNGMLIRLGFSVAAHLDPDVLIVDEVLGVGDATFQKKSLGKAREFREQGRTVLMVSHNLPMIASFCTRAILLRDGKLAADAPPNKVIEMHLASSEDGAENSSNVWSSSNQKIATEYMEVRSVEIVDSNGRAHLTYDAAIVVKIRYQVLKQGRRVCLQLMLNDETGVPLFKCINTPSMNLGIDPLHDQELAVGEYKCDIEIPAHFLNARRYLVSLCIGEEPNRIDYVADSFLGFRVHDVSTAESGTNVAWDAYLTRPRLLWNTKMLS